MNALPIISEAVLKTGAATPRTGVLLHESLEDASPVRILYVDDEPQLRILGKAMLTRAGYEVVTAADGLSAWTQLKEAHFNLLITDHNMPGLTGIDLLTLARRSGMRLPVILVSGTSKPMQDLSCSNFDVTAFLPKPFGFDDLICTVEEMLRTANSQGRYPNAIQGGAYRFPFASQPYQHGGIND